MNGRVPRFPKIAGAQINCPAACDAKTESYQRRMGLAIIRGGKHSLRFSPVFNIGEKGVDRIVNLTRQVPLKGPSG